MIIDLIRNTATIEVRVGPRGPRGEAGQSGASTWSEITGKPSTFPPSSHTHAQSDVTGLVSALTAKADLVGGKVPSSQLPSISLVDFLGAAANQSAMLALRGDAGDFCFRSDQGLAYFITSGNGSQLSHWQSMATPGNIGVASVNGHVGAVVLAAEDLGLGEVDNTSDADKPVSTAAQAALNDKADVETVTVTAAVAQVFELEISGAPGDWGGYYFDLPWGSVTTARVWFNLDDGNSAPAYPGALVEVTISTGQTSEQIAAALLAALQAESASSQYDVTAPTAGTLRFESTIAGQRAAPSLNGFAFVVLNDITNGADAVTGPALLQAQLLNALQAAISDGKITLPDGRYLVVMDAP